MKRAPSTLFTSPLSAVDFAVRLAFFAVAPFGIVGAAAFFPVIGALVSVGLALAVFLVGEAARERARGSRLVSALLARELALEAYYRARRPRPFLYYVLYPLLFPYWLVNREARREFVLWKRFTIGSFVVLLASASQQYLTSWSPDLSFRDYLPVLGVSVGVEWFLVLALLMPIATTVVGFHATMRRGRLIALLLVGLTSTGLAVARLARRRDPIVSYATRERVQLRTSKDRGSAREAQLAGLQAAWANWRALRGSIEGDGKVEGLPLDAARAALGRYYKPDEAFAFDLWASPRKSPRVLVLYFEARRRRDPIWVALSRDGGEITDADKLPKGAFAAMRHAAKE